VPVPLHKIRRRERGPQPGSDVVKTTCEVDLSCRSKERFC
jgi:hypothetical protein